MNPQKWTFERGIDFLLRVEVNTLNVSAEICVLCCCIVTVGTLIVPYLVMYAFGVYHKILIIIGFEVTLHSNA